MAANPWTLTNAAVEYIGDGLIDLDNDSFAVRLYLSTSNISNTSDLLAALTNEHANANGYTTGGVALGSPTWVRSGTVITFDSADVAWTASGGSIVARYAVIIDTTAAGSPVLCWTTLDNTPADVTVTDGNPLNLNMSASGIFTMTAPAAL